MRYTDLGAISVAPRSFFWGGRAEKNAHDRKPLSNRGLWKMAPVPDAFDAQVNPLADLHRYRPAGESSATAVQGLLEEATPGRRPLWVCARPEANG